MPLAAPIHSGSGHLRLVLRGDDFLLYLWITNLALLLGAEVDAELERSRQLIAGIEAEEDIQLPPRDDAKIRTNEEDDAKIRTNEEKELEDRDKVRALRRSGGDTTDPDQEH